MTLTTTIVPQIATSKVEELRLSENQLASGWNGTALRSLCTLLTQPSRLKRLELRKCGIGDRMAARLAHALSKPSARLEELCVSENQIGCVAFSRRTQCRCGRGRIDGGILICVCTMRVHIVAFTTVS